MEKFLPFFDDNKKAMDKIMINSLVKGGNEVKKILIKTLPPTLSKFKTVAAVKKRKSIDGVQRVEVGFFGRRLYSKRKSYNLDAYMILYWKNYGTLKNRDSGHQFKYNIRTAVPPSGHKVRKDRVRTSYQKNGGVMPANFFEQGAASSLSQAENATKKNIENEYNKLLQKWGFK